ncbi:OmpA family protein [Kosakonia sp. H02]|nr:OmpA family protein [Kosakonia sp. H02]
MPERSRLLLTILALLLALWLILGFWPLSTTSRWGLSLLVLVAGGGGLWHQWRHHHSRRDALSRFSADHLPPEDFAGSVLLMAGDAASWFVPGQPFRESRQGWYLQVKNPEQLPLLAEQLATLRPALLPQMTVMLALLPEQHTSDESFGQVLRTWQRAIVLCRPWLNGLPPLLAAVMVSAPSQIDTSENVPPARWFTVMPDLPGVRVQLPGQGALPVTDWLRESPAQVRLSRLSEAFWLDGVLSWYDRSVSSAMNTRQGDLPGLRPVGVALCLTPVAAHEDNLWQQHIASLTALPPSAAACQDVLPLPDMLLVGLSRRRGLSRSMQRWRQAGLIAGLFLLLAMLASFINNQRLVRSVGDHLALYHRQDGHPPASKTQAQQRLNADRRLLDDWLRRGTPMRYGLGLYQGQRLAAPVDAVLSDWAPPSPSRPVSKRVVQEPKTVRLDSMSLFDSGQSVLKTGSTRMLVNSLVGIKAKPGWLVLVSGHTDNTGNPKLNQLLSLKRAEAVRDWMRDTGDVPESCFAVQGYGESRPIATNDTPEGRVLNRRVEISLVPQAYACPLPGEIPASSQEDDASQLNGE